MKIEFASMIVLTMVCVSFALIPDGSDAESGEYEAKIGDANYTTFAEALEKAVDGDTIVLLSDVVYGSDMKVINISKSITIDGQNHSIIGYGVGTSTSIYINNGGTSSVDVILKNLVIVNDKAYGRAVTINNFVNSLSVDSCEFKCTGGGNTQVLTIGGLQDNTISISITNSKFDAGDSGYPIIIFNPIDLDIDGCDITGYCGVYFKSSELKGASGSKVTVSDSRYDCPNVHASGSNDFGVFALEDGNIQVSIVDCKFNAEATNGSNQSLIMESSYVEDSRRGDCTFVISGNILLEGTLVEAEWGSESATSIIINGGIYTDSNVRNYLGADCVCKEEGGLFTVSKRVTDGQVDAGEGSTFIDADASDVTVNVDVDGVNISSVQISSDSGSLGTLTFNVGAADEQVVTDLLGKASIAYDSVFDSFELTIKKDAGFTARIALGPIPSGFIPTVVTEGADSSSEVLECTLSGGVWYFTTTHTTPFVVVLNEDTSVPPVIDDDDELPFIPGQNQPSKSDDSTTLVAVAAGAAVVAIIAVLLVAIHKGKI